MDRTLPAKWSTSVRARESWWVLIALGVVYVYCFPYFAELKHANELPRILTTEQLAEHGTFRLDERMGDLGSRADISTTPDGHHYQNKAPGLSIIALPLYYPLSLGFGLAGRRPPIMLVTWLLRVVLATLPTIVFLSYFRAVAQRFATVDEARNAGLVAYALGSMALPFGMLFMSHAIAASLVGTAFAVSVATIREPSHSDAGGALVVGPLLGLSILCEYQAVFGMALVAGYFLWGVARRGRALFHLAVTIVPFLAVLAIYQWSAFGSPFRTGYAYSVDEANRVGIMGIVGFSHASLSQLFIDADNGLLVLSPWVVLAVVGAVNIARHRNARARVGPEALVAALVATVYCVFVASLHPSFGRGGWSVGPRYIAIAMPFFAWLSAAGLDLCMRYWATRVAAFGLIVIGVGIHVLAATTYPHWPIDFRNPLFEVTLRLLREGHAPHSLGTLVGLRGFASLVPLYAGVIALVVYLFSPTRRYALEVALAFVIATFAVSGYQRVAATPPQEQDEIWRFITSTYEP
jgi:hypothetical protein